MPGDSVITSEARATIGREATPMVEDVSRGAIRKFAWAVFDSNPLHIDDRAAEAGPHRGIIAPLAFCLTLGKHFAGEPQAFSLRPQLGLPNGVAGWDEFHYLAPLRPGDVITHRMKLADMYEKRGRLGPMVFLVFEHTYTNQRGELAVRASTASIAYSVANKVGGDAPAGPSQPATPDDTARESAPPLTKKIGMLEIVRFAGLTEQIGPGHIDKDYARKVMGLPDVNIQAGLKIGLLSTMLSNWCGATGEVKRIACQYRGLDFCDDTLTARAVVVSSRTEHGRRILECDLRIENQRGERNTRGSATVAIQVNADHAVSARP